MMVSKKTLRYELKYSYESIGGSVSQSHYRQKISREADFVCSAYMS
jgi:hypothetical protein